MTLEKLIFLKHEVETLNLLLNGLTLKTGVEYKSDKDTGKTYKTWVCYIERSLDDFPELQKLALDFSSKAFLLIQKTLEEKQKYFDENNK